MLFWVIWIISFAIILIAALDSKEPGDIGFLGVGILATINAYFLEFIIEFALSIAQ